MEEGSSPIDTPRPAPQVESRCRAGIGRALGERVEFLLVPGRRVLATERFAESAGVGGEVETECVPAEEGLEGVVVEGGGGGGGGGGEDDGGVVLEPAGVEFEEGEDDVLLIGDAECGTAGFAVLGDEGLETFEDDGHGEVGGGEGDQWGSGSEQRGINFPER